MFVFISLSPQAILIFLCAALTISGQRGDGNSNRRPGSNNNSGDNENSGGSTPGGRGNISFSDFAITAGGGSIVAIVIDPRIFPRCMTSTRYCKEDAVMVESVRIGMDNNFVQDQDHNSTSRFSLP
ncbi:hypothetical protein AX774_g1283 [Zancudomyces culisetae]|uniref:Uncharacterized protein n=1 Tax=Zancudomyces culisetae TaxID=1213189 RepID=A0A1R1PWB2_ZANCU|nr:hypothetical protein AX774_g1283 [Zancudomyces culisetae]|eukprot:OMH85182.1 hypothetical protein AX774_g1283 [Zancudomyces culisetae]